MAILAASPAVSEVTIPPPSAKAPKPSPSRTPMRISTPSSFKFWEDGVGNTLSFFKIRAAYGQAGIQPGPFQRYPVINQGDLGHAPRLFDSQRGQQSDLGVEVSTEKEIGADLTISAAKKGEWLNQINLSGTYWQEKNGSRDLDG